MTEIIGVRFKDGGKLYYFNPNGVQVQAGQHVIIETSKGIEFGECALANTMIDEMELIAALRPMLRVATEADYAQVKSNQEKEKKAFQICQDKIAEHKLEMKLVEVKYSFDGSKILFFFTADGRVDFRHLVKDLASIFCTRIELRQIGVRDEAKIMGGLGICGRPFCCSQFLSDFQPVSIKMAKTQNISLNPTKISGVCGRLMCCLKYEQDAYEDLLKDTPKLESLVNTPDGVGVVNQIQLLREQVKVVLDSDPDTPKVYRKEDIEIIRNGKGKRPPGYEFPVPAPEKKEPSLGLLRTQEQAAPMAKPEVEERPKEKKPEGANSTSHRSRRSRSSANRNKERPAAAHPEQGAAGEAKSGEKKPNSHSRRRHSSNTGSAGQQAKTEGQKQNPTGSSTGQSGNKSRSHRRRHHRPKGQGSGQNGAPKAEK
ncbi:MAG: stage 0 sporulation family protein [Eubacteriales bacterium]|nr:stage 0 sporulation family protein [Eubacteriales bacterium]